MARRKISKAERELAVLRERRAILELEREKVGLEKEERRLVEASARQQRISQMLVDSPYPGPEDGVDLEASLAETFTAYDWLDTMGPGGYANSWGQTLTPYGSFQSFLNPLSTRIDRDQGRDRPFLVTEIDLSLMRGMARILCEVNCPAKGAVRSMGNYVVGDKGFQYVIAKKHGKVKMPDGLIPSVQEEVDEFMEREHWSGCGPGGMEGELFWRSRRDGEYFLAMYCSQQGKTTARIVEPEQVTDLGANQWSYEHLQHYGVPWDTNDDWTWGIHTPRHDVNYRYGYNVWWDDLAGNDYLPGGMVQHVKLSERNIKRGISDFYCSLRYLQKADSLLNKTVSAAAVQASIAFIRKHAEGIVSDQVQAFRAARNDWSTTFFTPGGGSRTIQNYGYADGTILDAPAGQDYTPGPLGTERNQVFVEVCQAALRWVATQWSMPEFMISGDASNANYSCHDSATELMTKRGWLTHDQLRYGDVAGTMNPVTGEFEWQEIQAIHIHDYSGDMVRLSGKHNLDLLVTPNHRMYVTNHQMRRRDGMIVRDGLKPWRFVRADQLRGGMILPFACKPKQGVPQEIFEIPACSTTHVNPKTGKPQPRIIEARTLPMGSFLRFLGWWLAEGWTTTKTPAHHAHNVALSQTAHFLKECRDIAKTFNELPYNVRSWVSDDGMQHWQLTDKGLWLWLRSSCGTDSYTKRMPGFIHDLPAFQQQDFLDRLLLGDGHDRCGGSATYFSVSHELADQVQMLALQCGKISHRSPPMNNGVVPVPCKRSDRHIRVSKRHISRVPYSGKVWCVTVPNGLIVTRRNGKSIVTGNSTLVAESPFVKFVKGLQHGYGTNWMAVLWKVIENACRHGRFDQFGEWGTFAILKKYLKIQVEYPTVETRDPLQETQRRQILHDKGLLSKPTWDAQEGYDYEEQVAQGAQVAPEKITAKATGMDEEGGITALASPGKGGGKGGAEGQAGGEGEAGGGPGGPAKPSPKAGGQPAGSNPVQKDPQEPEHGTPSAMPAHESAGLIESAPLTEEPPPDEEDNSPEEDDDSSEEYTQRPDGTEAYVAINKQVEDALGEIMPGEHIDADKMSKLCGVIGNGHIKTDLAVRNDGQKGIFCRTNGEVDGGKYETKVILYNDSDGNPALHNDLILCKDQSHGTGTRILWEQVKEARKSGVKSIDLMAAGGATGEIGAKHRNGQWVGYYTWPRLGFDGPLWDDLGNMNAIRTALREPGDLETKAIEHSDPEAIKEKFPDAKRVSDLMKTEEGRQYWMAYGWPMNMKLDLTEGSKGVEVLKQYYEKKFGTPAVETATTEAAPRDIGDLDQAKYDSSQWGDTDILDEQDEKLLDELWHRIHGGLLHESAAALNLALQSGVSLVETEAQTYDRLVAEITACGSRKPIEVYRGLCLASDTERASMLDGFRRCHESGGLFVDSAFSSHAMNREAFESVDLGPHAIELHVFAKSGSAHDGELLCKPGTQYHVREVFEYGGKHPAVLLEEVELSR